MECGGEGGSGMVLLRIGIWEAKEGRLGELRGGCSRGLLIA